MINYKWTVKQMLTQTINGEQNYVVVVNYEVVGTDGEFTSSISDSMRFSTENVSSFIPYSELTEDVVLGWVKGILGSETASNYEESIAGQIENQKNPPVSPEITPLPWN